MYIYLPVAEDTYLNNMKKVMLIYPPGKLYQRGEDRCQSNVEAATSTSVRACNDLGYVASTLLIEGYQVFLKDYQTERITMERLRSDFKRFSPDVLWISITNATIFYDLEVVKTLKKISKSLVVILKGALFFSPEQELLNQLDLSDISYLVGGESDFIAANLIRTHFDSPADIPTINGILYKQNGQWLATKFTTFETDLDSLPFPARHIMPNDLYVRPDTGELQATIATSRGCSANCIYCLTPHISGRKLRLRSPENIVEELRECFNQYHIRNFFFKSDTFTLNSDWTKELCERIIESDLGGKIQWVANSRTNPICKQTLGIMKDAGCWLVAFGFESGSPETLQKIKKGATMENNLAAARYAKEVGLKIFGFYLVGFPWETMTHLQQTERMMYEIDADFVELHIAVPYYGTALYKMAKEEGLISESILGKDYFNPPDVGTKFIDFSELVQFRKHLLLKYHIRPTYILKKLREALGKPAVLKNYVRFGGRLLRQSFK